MNNILVAMTLLQKYSYLQEHISDYKPSNLLQDILIQRLLVIYCNLITTIMHVARCIVLQVQILDTFLNVYERNPPLKLQMTVILKWLQL